MRINPDMRPGEQMRCRPKAASRERLLYPELGVDLWVEMCAEHGVVHPVDEFPDRLL